MCPPKHATGNNFILHKALVGTYHMPQLVRPLPKYIPSVHHPITLPSYHNYNKSSHQWRSSAAVYFGSFPDVSKRYNFLYTTSGRVHMPALLARQLKSIRPNHLFASQGETTPAVYSRPTHLVPCELGYAINSHYIQLGGLSTIVKIYPFVQCAWMGSSQSRHANYRNIGCTWTLFFIQVTTINSIRYPLCVLS